MKSRIILTFREKYSLKSKVSYHVFFTRFFTSTQYGFAIWWLFALFFIPRSY